MKDRISKALRLLETCSLQDEKEKFNAGRIVYGGDFKPQLISHEIEQIEEILDFANYCDMERFAQFLEDPVTFKEFVSQYMQ